MVASLALLGVSILTAVVFHLVLRTRWRRRSIQGLLQTEATNCRELRDLEKALRQAYQESGIPKVLVTAADVLTLLCAVGVVLAWVDAPSWHFSLGATLLLPLGFTVFFYHAFEFAGPWWRFPAAYIQPQLDRQENHDWDGCECRDCRASRNGGHRWNGACQCEVCGAVRHRWNAAAECVRCGAKREEPFPEGTSQDAREAAAEPPRTPSCCPP